jgi:hypothetical protein
MDGQGTVGNRTERNNVKKMRTLPGKEAKAKKKKK